MKRYALVIALCLVIFAPAWVSAGEVPFDFPSDAVKGVTEVNMLIFNGGEYTNDPTPIAHVTAVLSRYGIKVNPTAEVRLEVHLWMAQHPEHEPLKAFLIEILAVKDGNLIWRARAMSPTVGMPGPAFLQSMEAVLGIFANATSPTKACPKPTKEVEV